MDSLTKLTQILYEHSGTSKCFRSSADRASDSYYDPFYVQVAFIGKSVILSAPSLSLMKGLRNCSVVLLRLHLDFWCRSIPHLASADLGEHFVVFLKSLYHFLGEHLVLCHFFLSHL